MHAAVNDVVEHGDGDFGVLSQMLDERIISGIRTHSRQCIYESKQITSQDLSRAEARNALNRWDRAGSTTGTAIGRVRGRRACNKLNQNQTCHGRTVGCF